MAKFRIAFLSLLLAGILLLTGCANVPTEDRGIDITMYKSASCGCCGIWAKYAEKEGFYVDVQVLDSVDLKKQELGVPVEVSSCHTSVIEEYVVEGHVPVEVIDKLLEERPDIKGISLPGMPSGSPGMPGPKNQDWTIYAIHHDGSTSEFMVI